MQIKWISEQKRNKNITKIICKTIKYNHNDMTRAVDDEDDDNDDDDGGDSDHIFKRQTGIVWKKVGLKRIKPEAPAIQIPWAGDYNSYCRSSTVTQVTMVGRCAQTRWRLVMVIISNCYFNRTKALMEHLMKVSSSSSTSSSPPPSSSPAPSWDKPLWLTGR